jgi:hypothetical protein
MEGRKVALLQRIESDHEVLLDFLRGFIRCPSPNPPGDTREAADHIRQFLEQHAAECRVIAPNEVMPNIVATFEAEKPGRHLALNGHIDCFPMGEAELAVLDRFEEVSKRPELMLEFTLRPGEVYFINNYTILHARTAFDDGEAEEDRRRHLLRLWLEVPGMRPVHPHIRRNGIEAVPGRTPSYDWSRIATGGRATAESL